MNRLPGEPLHEVSRESPAGNRDKRERQECPDQRLTVNGGLKPAKDDEHDAHGRRTAEEADNDREGEHCRSLREKLDQHHKLVASRIPCRQPGSARRNYNHIAARAAKIPDNRSRPVRDLLRGLQLTTLTTRANYSPCSRSDNVLLWWFEVRFTTD